MKIEPAVKKETGIIACGVTLMSAVMVGIFAIAGHFDMTVLWGAVLGTVLAVGNFFLMGLGVQAAADKMNGVQLPPLDEEGQEEQARQEEEATMFFQGKSAVPTSPEAQSAKRLVQLSYHGRMLLCILVLVLALVIPVFNIMTAAIPLLFPRLIIMGQGVVQKIKEGK